MEWNSRRLGAWFTTAMLVCAALVLGDGARARPRFVKWENRDAMLERGEYLVALMGCDDCHTPGTMYNTPDGKRRLAGSELAWRGWWGTTFARNLTPDAATGLGIWSEEQIAHALRTGERADGTVLRPPMTWRDFSHVTDEDLMAIAGYLKSLPAVHHIVPTAMAPGGFYAGPVITIPSPGPWDTPRFPTGPENLPGRTNAATVSSADQK